MVPHCAQEAYEICNWQPGYAPIVTADTLEQVHLLLFTMAVVHILLSMLVLLMAACKLWFWARMAGGAEEDALATAALVEATACSAELGGIACRGEGRSSSGSDGTATKAAAACVAHRPTADVHSGAPDTAPLAASVAEPAVPVVAAAAQQIEAGSHTRINATRISSAAGLVVKEWAGRPAHLQVRYL